IDGGGRPVRLAVVAAMLRAAIERGEPFGSELRAAQVLADDPAVLAPLEGFATSGVPAAATLARELARLTPSLLNAGAAPAPDASILARLQSSAGKLVRVRPIEEMPGDELAAIVARIELRAAQVDVAGALAELAKLPPVLSAPAQAWTDKARAREAAVEAGRK